MLPELEAPPASPVNILFHGAGAIGSFYASQLHHPDKNVFVSLTARSNFQVIAENALRMESKDFGNYTFRPHAVYKGVAPAVPTSLVGSAKCEEGTSVGSNPPDRWDVVVVSTKALPDQPPGDAETIAPLVTPGHTVIMLIQNGVGIEVPMRSKFPENPILTSVAVMSTVQTSPGVVKQNRWTRLQVGPYSTNPQHRGGEQTDLASRLEKKGTDMARKLAVWWGSDPDAPIAHAWTKDKAELLAKAEEAAAARGWGRIRDVEVHNATDIQCVRWHKLSINASFNPTAVLSGGRPNAELVGDPDLRRHIKGIMEEVLAAAPVVLGLGDKLPERLGLAEPELMLKSTQRNPGAKPSMLLDWEAGRKMELEVILGNAVRMAREKGFEMKRVETVYALLKSVEMMKAAGTSVL